MMIFCCKKKTVDDVRISDWSSDVCCSDLGAGRDSGEHDRAPADSGARAADRHDPAADHPGACLCDRAAADAVLGGAAAGGDPEQYPAGSQYEHGRSEERRVGKEVVSTCRYRWSLEPSQTNQRTHEC